MSHTVPEVSNLQQAAFWGALNCGAIKPVGSQDSYLSWAASSGEPAHEGAETSVLAVYMEVINLFYVTCGM